MTTTDRASDHGARAPTERDIIDGLEELIRLAGDADLDDLSVDEPPEAPQASAA